MSKRLVALALLVPALAACGGKKATETLPTTTTHTVPVSPQPMAITVFRVDQGLLRPSVEHVPRTQAVATAALGALDVGAPVRIAGGTATVDLATATADQQAEIVYTLTQFSSVQRVDVA